MRDSAKSREYFRHFLPITTRWADNDVYGHVNNVVFYQWFDTVVNQFLISRGTLDIHGGDAIALVVETHCNYFCAGGISRANHCWPMRGPAR
jgi:acyl-CoA thioester hydrolase